MYALETEHKLPEGLAYLPWAEEEMRRATVLPSVFVRRSDPVWVLTDDDNHTYAVIGVITPTLASTPEVWILLCEGFKKNLKSCIIALRENMTVLLDRFPHVMVKVDAAAPCGRKLVESLGFTPYHRDFRDGREFIFYEARK